MRQINKKSGAVVGFLLGVSLAQAQTAPQTPPQAEVALAAPASDATSALDEMVVSASRAEERSFNIPGAVQSVDRDVIQNSGPQVNLSESLVRIPGLTILDRENYAQDLQVSIRGFGARSAFGIAGVRLFIDGIPATTPDGQGEASSISLTSTDHIEVLRGPLAEMYGNSSGGVIQAFTRAAPATPTVDSQYDSGSFGMHHSDVQFGDTVGTIGMLGDFSSFSTAGYRTNSAAQRDQFNGTMRLTPNDQTQVNLVFNQFVSTAQDALGLTAQQMARDPTQAGVGAVANATGKDLSQDQVGGSVVYAMDADSSVTAHAYFGTRVNLQYQASSASSGTWVGLDRHYYGVGAQYNEHTAWANMPVDWVSGYNYDLSREFRQGGLSSSGGPIGTFTRDEDDQGQNSDFFTQARAMVSERVALTGGLRYSTVQLSSADYMTNGSSGSGGVIYQATTPVLGVTWFATDHLNLYANAGQGFETPTLAEMTYQATSSVTVAERFNTSLMASHSQHYEVGSKWVPTPDTRLDFALYQVNTNNEIVTTVNAGGKSAYDNAPSTTRTGFELAGSAVLTPHVTAVVSASAIDAVYSQSFESNLVNIAAGNHIPGIPSTSLFSELAWNSEVVPARKGAPTMGSRLAAELVESGHLYADDTNLDSAAGHTVLNLSASQNWALGKGSMGVFARVNNVTNEHYVSSVIVDQSALQFYESGLPCNWMLGVHVNVPL